MRVKILALGAAFAFLFFSCGEKGSGNSGGGKYTVVAYNDLGMHCMNQDDSELMILPPFNTMHAQVIKRGENPQIIQSGLTLKYSVPGNTFSEGKTNFWDYVSKLLGVDPAPNVGLAGNMLEGSMVPSGNGDWVATGIPLTPQTDAGAIDPYQFAQINLWEGGTIEESTRAVIPVSWEIRCDLCHNTPGLTTAEDILTKHDAMHGTNHMANRPIQCGKCHQQPELGDLAPGTEPHEPLSHVIHHSHSMRMDPVMGIVGVECYACHPGITTKCLRDVHARKGFTCHNCHGQMMDVADETRHYWQDEPQCGKCHFVTGHTYEQEGVLFRKFCGARRGALHDLSRRAARDQPRDQRPRQPAVGRSSGASWAAQ